MKKVLGILIVFTMIFAFVGCSKQVPDVPVSDIVDAIKEQMAEDMKNAGVPEENFQEENLPGYLEVNLTLGKSDPMTEMILKVFNKEDLEEGFALVPMMNVNSDQIFVLKAADESKIDVLKEALEKEKEKQEQTWSSYLPDQYEKVKNNIIKVNGKYLIYITYDNPEKIEEIFDNSFQ